MYALPSKFEMVLFRLPTEN